MQSGIFKKINSRYDNLTKTFKNIADYIRMNPRDLYVSSASELAKKAGTSDASIVRFCQELGYSGYNQLKEEFVKNAGNDGPGNFSDIMENLADIGSSREYIEKAFQYEILTLTETIRNFNFSDIKKAVDHIEKANLIYITGLGSCSILAASLYYHLDRLQLPCKELTTSGFLLAEHLCNIKQEDVLLLLSYPGYSTDSRNALNIAKERGAHTILITDKNKNPLTEIADTVLVAPSKNPFLFYNSYTGALALCNMLVLEYAFRDYDSNAEILKNIRRFSEPYKI